MKKEILVICLITIISSFCCCFGDIIRDYGHYNRDIEKNIDNEEEAKALEIAENYNYSEVFNIERFENGDFTYANFVDSQVIEYYNKKYEIMEDQEAEHDIEFIYQADVYNISELQIIYDHIPDYEEYELEIYDESNRILKIKGEILPRIITVFNDTNYTLKDINKDFQIEFSEVYLVYQDFEYSDFWGPKAGRATLIVQIVVLNKEYQPLFILIDSGHLIS